MSNPRLIVSSLCLVAACGSGSTQTAPAPVSPTHSTTSSGSAVASRVNAIADDYWTTWVQTFPLGALFSGVPDAPNDRIGDNSLAAVSAWARQEDRWRHQLHRFAPKVWAGQPEDATYGVLLETLEASRQGRICRGELLPLNQQNG